MPEQGDDAHVPVGVESALTPSGMVHEIPPEGSSCCCYCCSPSNASQSTGGGAKVRGGGGDRSRRYSAMEDQSVPAGG